MNKVVLTGRLGRDPEIRVTQDGKTAVGKFSLAVDRWKDGVDFFNITAFGKTAEFAEKYLKKGMKINLIGRLQTDSYTNKDGQKMTSTVVIADEVEPLERKKEPEQGFLDIPDGDDMPFKF